MTLKTRGQLITDLGEAVDELTEPRTHTEHLEAYVTEDAITRKGKRRTRRRRVRKAHIVTLPGLIGSLEQAVVPGASADGPTVAGGFESRPAADIGPASVLREIVDGAEFWTAELNVPARTNLAATLRGLISARHDDQQLRRLARDAQRWVRLARLATGYDPQPMTIEAPCPYCTRRHALVIAGDMTTARCSRCGVRWDIDTIGLLADMLQANVTQETMPLVPCWWPECALRGPHEEHQDGAGRAWRDWCDVERAVGE